MKQTYRPPQKHHKNIMEPATEEDAESIGESEEDVLDDERDYIIKSIGFVTNVDMESVANDGMKAAIDDVMEADSDDGMETVADDGMEAAADDGMETVTDDGIRDRFQLFFNIHPDLKPGMWALPKSMI